VRRPLRFHSGRSIVRGTIHRRCTPGGRLQSPLIHTPLMVAFSVTTTRVKQHHVQSMKSDRNSAIRHQLTTEPRPINFYLIPYTSVRWATHFVPRGSPACRYTRSTCTAVTAPPRLNCTTRCAQSAITRRLRTRNPWLSNNRVFSGE